VVRERVLDFSRLHAMLADLDLVIDATKELHGAIGPISRQVAGRIQACVEIGR